jgi:pimeloyl-ACP methyl ester carboxylesterase
MIKEGKGDELIPGDLFGWMKICAKSYVDFFGKDSKADIFNYLKKDNWEVINKIDIPVIAFTGTDDYAIVPIIDPYEGMQILEKQLINSPRKKTVVYEGANHDFKGFGEEITKEVLDFIN